MSENRSHIDDAFIPEGLEFKEEYLNAALQQYRKRKRVIFWRKSALVLLSMLIISVGIFYGTLDNTITKTIPLGGTAIDESTTHEKNSSPFDLEQDEDKEEAHRQSPSVESLEATQDLSMPAVDMSSPMSSGVGLPIQPSTSIAELSPNPSRSKEPNTVGSATTSRTLSTRKEVEDLPQNSLLESEDVEASASTPIDFIAYRRAALPPVAFELIPSNPMRSIPNTKWSAFATVGFKAWADFAFQQSPFKPDLSAGLGVNYKINRRISAEMSGHCFTVSGKANPYTVIQRQFAEGFQETTHRYYTDRFFTSGLAGGVKINATRSHTFGISWKTDFLLTANNRIETGRSSSYENLITESLNTKGYIQGYRTVQQAIVFTYEYTLGRNKSVGANYQLGLTDITKNEYFGNSSDKNSMLSLYIRLKLTP